MKTNEILDIIVEEVSLSQEQISRITIKLNALLVKDIQKDIDNSWKNNPDRSGGWFSPDEYNTENW